jgi:SET domain-containing protein
MYKPIPDELTIKNSKIHGQGVFATQNIEAGCELGVTHVELPDTPYYEKLFRTPLGGFLNHSSTPNCFIHDWKATAVDSDTGLKSDFIESTLYAIKPIKKGEELTVYYRKYDV